MITWVVMTRRGEVKFGMMPRWPAPKYYGLPAAWKEEALLDFVASGVWKDSMRTA